MIRYAPTMLLVTLAAVAGSPQSAAGSGILTALAFATAWRA